MTTSLSLLIMLFGLCSVVAFRSITIRSPIRFHGLTMSTNETPIKPTDIGLLEIRTGKIIEVDRHPEADGLYVEKIDVGEVEGPRTIVSGLVKYCTIEELLNREVVVLCNLKPRALKGITSFGMLLCASADDKVVPLSPPTGTPIGELITFEGNPSAPAEPSNRATKAFGKVADDLFVDENMQATYKGIPFMTTKGVVTSTLKGSIS